VNGRQIGSKAVKCSWGKEAGSSTPARSPPSFPPYSWAPFSCDFW
jgi:hypothetical protein